MNVASLELCKELYELSEWDESRDRYYPNKRPELQVGPFQGKLPSTAVPAYTLGYLLRKLPNYIKETEQRIFMRSYRGNWGFGYAKLREENSHTNLYAEADTPENATAKLAIELHKQGVLTASAGIGGEHDS